MSKRTAGQKISQFVRLGILGGGVCGGLLLQRHDDRASRAITSLVTSVMNAEAARRSAVLALSRGCYFRSRLEDKPGLRLKLWGREFRNPVGIAGDFDREGEAVQGLSDLGFGFVEVGPVTPQEGLSDGHTEVRRRLELLRAGGYSGIIGVSLGKNETSDICEGVRQFANLTDYLVINISSQDSRDDLKSLIQAVLKTRQDLNLSQPPALVIKISPDLTEVDMKNIAEVITSSGTRVDGIIVGHRTETEDSKHAIGTMSRLTGGEVPIIGAGGVTTGQEAVMMIRAGASLVQVTTGLMVRGPATATNIRRELSEALVTQGAESVTQCVGAELR